MTQFAFGISFEELYARAGLIKLDAAFVDALKAADTVLFNRFMAARADGDGVAGGAGMGGASRAG